MAFKFVLFAALCAAMALALKPLPPTHGKPPCRKPISESAEAIPHEFEETMHEMDEMSETVSVAAMEAYYKGKDPEVIIECFREQKGNWSRLGKKISGMITQASKDMAEILGDKYEKYSKRAEAPLKTIAITIKSLPTKMWLHIKEKEFSQAMEVMRASRKTVEENSRILGKLVIEMAEEAPEAAKKAEEMAHEIRTAARTGCHAIGEAFGKCVEAGGPKKPAKPEQEPEIEDDVEE